MHVEAENYEGGWLSIHVEKQNDAGEWEVYMRWQGEIGDGKYDTAFAIPPRPEEPEQWKGKVVELSFPEPPRENEPAWMLAKTEGFDRSQLQFVLERTDANGNWYELGTAVSTVADNAAKNSVPVPALLITRPGEAAPQGMEAIRFAKDVFSTKEELIVWVDPVWLESGGFQVTLEQRVMVDGGNWTQVAVVDANPSAAADQPGPGDKSPAPTLGDSGTSAAADSGTGVADSGASAGSDAASAGSDASSAGDAAQSAGDAGDPFSNTFEQADSAQAQADAGRDSDSDDESIEK